MPFKKPDEKPQSVKNGSPKTEPISPNTRHAEQKDTQTLNPSEILMPINTESKIRDIKDDVEIVDIFNNKAQRFNFYVHCSKCDWEGRTFYKENAISMREQHIFNHIVLKNQG